MSSKRELTVAGQKIWLCAITGTVAGEKKWSESRTTGGSYTPSGRTHISTSVNTRHEFWLVAPDGEERCVELGDSTTSVREHQVVTAVWGAKKGREGGPFLLLQNHNAQTEGWLVKSEASVLKRMGLSDPLLRWSLMGGVAGLIALLVVRGPVSMLLLLLLAAGGMLYGAVQRRAKVQTLKEAATEVVKLEMGRQQARAAALEGADPLLSA